MNANTIYKYNKFNNLDPINSAKKVLKEHFSIKTKEATNEFEKNWYKMKYHHSLEVYKIVCEMIKKESKLSKLSKKEKDIIKASCILHDSGRFYQVKKEKLLKLRHGSLGAKILNDKNKIKDKKILFLVKHHEGYFDYKKDKYFKSLNTNTKEKLELMLFAVRDADIISISKKVLKLKRAQIVLTNKINYKIQISNEIYNACLEGRTFRLKHEINSWYEKIFTKICLAMQLHFNFSRRKLKEMNYLKFLFKNTNDIKKETKKLKLASKQEYIELNKKLNTLKKLAKNKGLI